MMTPSQVESPWHCYETAFDSWRQHAGSVAGLGRDTSIGVYRAMWQSLSKWALAQTPPIAMHSLSRQDLERFLQKRSEVEPAGVELSPRYVWRLLHLVDRVLCHDASCRDCPAPIAAAQLLQARPEWQYANAADKNPPPEYLTPSQARALVTYLTGHRTRQHGNPTSAPPWQETRNRAMVAVMLGAGLAPGEARALARHSVPSADGPLVGEGRSLRIASHEPSRRRTIPMALWAWQALQAWIELRARLAIPGNSLFPSTRTGKPIGKVAQYEAVRQVMTAAGLPADVVGGGSFRLRHTFAVRQLRRGRAPVEVAAWLGIDTAEMARYARLFYAPLGQRLSRPLG